MNLLTSGELAGMLKVHPGSVRRMLCQDRIPRQAVLKPFGENGRTMFDAELIDDWLRSTRESST